MTFEKIASSPAEGKTHMARTVRAGFSGLVNAKRSVMSAAGSPIEREADPRDLTSPASFERLAAAVIRSCREGPQPPCRRARAFASPPRSGSDC